MKHVLDSMKHPSLVEVEENLYVLRFESMKLASADAAVSELLGTGKIVPGGKVVDSSSGIYAVALALAAHKYNLSAHIVASTTVDDVTDLQLRCLGASVERVPPSGSLKLDQGERVRRVHRFLHNNPDAHWMQQYHDPIHYLGYRNLARSLDLPKAVSEIDLVGSVGSGASTRGIWEGLNGRLKCRVHGIQPYGSVTFGSEDVEDPDMIIAGVGSAIHFENVDHGLYDSIDWISFHLGAAATLSMYSQWGLFAGVSTGCCYLVAKRILHERRSSECPTIVIAPDTGHRYASALSSIDMETAAVRVEQSSPLTVKTRDELRLPWCRAEKEDLEGGWDDFRYVVGN